MNGKTHAAVGLCAASFLLVPKVSIETSLIGLGATVIGSYATDADKRETKAGQVASDVIYGVSILVTIYLILTYKFHYNVEGIINKNMPSQLKIFGVALIISSVVLGRITGHRKSMHSIFAGLVPVSIGVWLIAGSFVIWFSLGYALHIILDLLNEKPEALLYPLHTGDICFYLCRSDGLINWIIEVVAYIVFLYRIVSIYNLGYLYKIFIK
jgi:inner membrane protein